MINASMRTTLDIDPDVLRAAEEIAAYRGSSVGKVLSELAREPLEPRIDATVGNGVPLLPRRRSDNPMPTLGLVNRLRDEP